MDKGGPDLPVEIDCAENFQGKDQLFPKNRGVHGRAEFPV
jgi:hypothetical protein